MAINNSDTENTNPTEKKSSLRRLPGKSKKLVLLFVGLFAVIGVYALLQTNAAPKQSAAAVTLSLSPASQRIQNGQTINLAVKLNTNGQAVNAVQAHINYPADRFEFVSIDGAGSAFSVEAESSGAAGSIKIARGSINSITSSDALVATIQLKAVSTGRKVNVSIADTSMVVRTSDSTNILQKRSGGSYTIQ